MQNLEIATPLNRILDTLLCNQKNQYEETKMGRPRTPTNVLNLKGSFNSHADRKRARENEPKPEEIEEAPDSLDDDHKVIWYEILESIPVGVIGQSDALALEMLTKLIYIMRYDFSNMSGVQLGRTESLFARFGMTPSDRSKVSVPPKKEENPFDQF